MSLRASARGPAKGHPLRGEEPQGSVAPPLAFGRWGAWRTLGRRGVAIRFPAEIPDMSVVLRANSQCFSYSPKVLLFVMYCRKECGLPRRFAPRNDSGEASLYSLTRPRPLRTLRTKRPCPRAHVLPSACHCEPVRTLAWQSASQQKHITKLAVLWANP